MDPWIALSSALLYIGDLAQILCNIINIISLLCATLYEIPCLLPNQRGDCIMP